MICVVFSLGTCLLKSSECLCSTETKLQQISKHFSMIHPIFVRWKCHISYLFAPCDRHLLKFPIAELGIRADRQTCEVDRKTQDSDAAYQSPEQPEHTLVLFVKSPCKTLKQQALLNTHNNKWSEFFPTNRTRSVFPQMSNSVSEAGSGNVRDMLTVWFWHMGIRAGPAAPSGWGKIYCCWTKALEAGSGQRAGDSPAHTDMKGFKVN